MTVQLIVLLILNHGRKQTDALNSVVIFSIRDDRYGNLWIAGQYMNNNKIYIAAFNNETQKFKQYADDKKRPAQLNATGCYEIFEDAQGMIWFGTDNGLYKYDHKNDKIIPYFTADDPAQQKSFSHFQQDASNADIFWVNEWIQSPYKDELWRFNTSDKSIKKFGHDAKDPTSLASDTIRSLQKDSRGRMWVGTNNGLSLFDTATGYFINYMPRDENQSLNDNIIAEIKEDKSGNFWCATDYGLLYFETKTEKFTRYEATAKNVDMNGLADNDIHHLLIDRAGTLWFGARDIGLQWINKGLSKTVLYKNDPGQPHNFSGGAAQCFAEAPDSTFYIGTRRGLYHWQPATDSFTLIQFTKYRNEDIPVRVVAVDRQGLVWYNGFVSGDNKYTGLFCFDPATGKTKQYLHDDKDSTSLSNDNVSYIFEDHSATLWVGTWGGGLCSFNRATQSFTRYPYIINNI
jgi:ligand-binding sensor domain-containing protein